MLVLEPDMPFKINFTSTICKSNHNQKFIIFGAFSQKKLEVNKPTVKFLVNKVDIPLKWVFFLGGRDKEDDDETNSFTLRNCIMINKASKHHPSIKDFLYLK